MAGGTPKDPTKDKDKDPLKDKDDNGNSGSD